ncbi:MAG: hypothetical protein A2Z21_01220 [Candidatus Fraserbacteria bacterium RBG_16_55_9]|uniref:site-specific DNA-methyltransferase (adenine-specific) n=1 Tax=Fraserbacteria sp. (strain RBG_16_55_9) TaxID=1817864 RepID=A0A1F5UZP7_FRAXR|nr:MAG: hypothetical protein A2Z21_01220 [Candidatus Fraserbacteria bacterium RBG_16_55_9]
MLEVLESNRSQLSSALDPQAKVANGQFLTPSTIAAAMADMFSVPLPNEIVLLDPGAGSGILTIAFLERVARQSQAVARVKVFAYENDDFLARLLESNLHNAAVGLIDQGIELTYNVLREDFILSASRSLVPPLLDALKELPSFTHVIMNPPYHKLSSGSDQRTCLERAGIQTSNLYSAFVALALPLLREGGELVAITPRSFCNGPYFRPFRRHLLDAASFERIHVFERRDDAFSEDKVLQENIIFHLRKSRPQRRVELSSSLGRSLESSTTRLVPHESIVQDGDPDLVIRIPSNESDDYVLERMTAFTNRLHDLGLQVSTGPVVDFRLRRHILDQPDRDSVPLIYSAHFVDQHVEWPIESAKKPNAIACNERTRRWLYPNSCYVLTRRFSSKEEKRRIYPALFSPIEDYDWIGFENHVNVVKSPDNDLYPTTAFGMVSYLSSKIVDLFFRQFSGHTQVNAADLRLLPVPPSSTLSELANYFDGKKVDTQAVDAHLEYLFKIKYGITSPNPAG